MRKRTKLVATKVQAMCRNTKSGALLSKGYRPVFAPSKHKQNTPPCLP